MTYRDKWDKRDDGKKPNKTPKWVERFGIILVMLGILKFAEICWWTMTSIVDSPNTGNTFP